MKPDLAPWDGSRGSLFVGWKARFFASTLITHRTGYRSPCSITSVTKKENHREKQRIRKGLLGFPTFHSLKSSAVAWVISFNPHLWVGTFIIPIYRWGNWSWEYITCPRSEIWSSLEPRFETKMVSFQSPLPSPGCCWTLPTGRQTITDGCGVTAMMFGGGGDDDDTWKLVYYYWGCFVPNIITKWFTYIALLKPPDR